MTDKSLTALTAWQPDRFLDEHGAVRLYAKLVRRAIEQVEAERLTGSHYPPKGSMPWRACVAERTYQLCESWKSGGEIATLYVTKWIQQSNLFLYHPRQWATVEQMLQDIAEDSASASGKSIYTRLATEVMPYLKEKKLAGPGEIAASLLPGRGGRKSAWYHMVPLLANAISHESSQIEAMVNDILDASKPANQVVSTWQGKLPIAPAPATLHLNGDGLWHMEIVMDESQKRLVLSRLRQYVAYNESPWPAEKVLERLYPKEDK